MLQGVESHFRASQTQAWEVQPLHGSRENQPFLQGWDWDGKDPGQEGFGLVCAGPDPHPREAESFRWFCSWWDPESQGTQGSLGSHPMDLLVRELLVAIFERI